MAAATAGGGSEAGVTEAVAEVVMQGVAGVTEAVAEVVMQDVAGVTEAVAEVVMQDVAGVSWSDSMWSLVSGGVGGSSQTWWVWCMQRA